MWYLHSRAAAAVPRCANCFKMPSYCNATHGRIDCTIDRTITLAATCLLAILALIFFVANSFMIFVFRRKNLLKKRSYYKFFFAAILGLAFVSSGNAVLNAVRVAQLYAVPLFANLS